MRKANEPPRLDGALLCSGRSTEFEGGDVWEEHSGRFRVVSAGFNEDCAISLESTVTCWSFGNWEQSDAAVGSFRSISAGGSHGCAVKVDDSVVCWGDDGQGQAAPPQIPSGAPLGAPAGT